MTGALNDSEFDREKLIRHLERAQRLSDTGSWEWDILTDDIVWSAQIYRIFGLAPHAFAPTYPAFLERVHPDDRALVEQRVGDAIEGRQAYDLDHRIVLPDGNVRIVHERGEVEYAPDGRPVRILGAVQDVTHIRTAEMASRRSQDLLASMLKISPEAIVVTDSAAVILAFSAGAEAIFGYSAGEVLGRKVEHLMPQRFHSRHHRHVEGFIAGARPSLTMHERSEIFGRRKTGEEFPAEASLARLETADGFAFIVVLRDLSERKAAEGRLIEAREQAERANFAKSDFLANMSHEIRTPLNGVLGIAGALARTELSAKQAEMVNLIETSGRALQGLLSDILDLAKIDAGRFSVRAEPFELDGLIADTFALFRAGAAEKNIDFSMSIAADASGHYLGDDLKIRQVLSNLLSNAVKFTEHGGIRLSVANLNPSDGDCRIRFVVEDTGIGFAPEIAQSLFERFEQADGSITRRFGGTGLGLSISKALVTLMQGDISATSTPGRGSTFLFELPLKRAEAILDLPLRSPAIPPDRKAEPLRVLLAEDYPINRLAVEMILDELSVDLTCVENGLDAVLAAEAQDYDLILMDMQMPVMDGLTAIRRIRAREAAGGGAGIPICVLTANAMPEHREDAEAAGANAFLTKPIDAGLLISLVLEFAATGVGPGSRGPRSLPLARAPG
ncbi:MAG: ATP-binding protein [Phenylobacterium sp.]|nr:ATP-binding protein [Phenylobacterium sp.]